MNQAVSFRCRVRAVSIFAAVMVTGLLLVACGSSSSSSSASGSTSSAAAGTGSASTQQLLLERGCGASKHLKLAYLSFAVAEQLRRPDARGREEGR